MQWYNKSQIATRTIDDSARFTRGKILKSVKSPTSLYKFLCITMFYDRSRYIDRPMIAQYVTSEFGEKDRASSLLIIFKIFCLSFSVWFSVAILTSLFSSPHWSEIQKIFLTYIIYAYIIYVYVQSSYS